MNLLPPVSSCIFPDVWYQTESSALAFSLAGPQNITPMLLGRNSLETSPLSCLSCLSCLAFRDWIIFSSSYPGHTIQEATEDGESLLSLACSAGYYELAEVLLRMRASVEDRGVKGMGLVYCSSYIVNCTYFSLLSGIACYLYCVVELLVSFPV